MDDGVELIRERSHAPGCWQEGKESWRLVKSSISSAVCKEIDFMLLTCALSYFGNLLPRGQGDVWSTMLTAQTRLCDSARK